VQGRRIPGEFGLDCGLCILYGDVLLVVKIVSV